jgi:hypothetical protein
MPRLIEPDMVEPVVRALLGAIDTGDGGTEEQRRVLDAFVTGYWGRTDLDVAVLSPAEPEQAAAEITGAAPRRRTRELMVLLELCRHPLTDAQVARADTYAAALDETGPGLELARELVRDGAKVAMADYMRRVQDSYGELSEPSLRAAYGVDLDEPDPALSERLRAMRDLPPGTLGHEYFAFLDTHGFQFPGETTSVPAVFVAHDMCHVITGYGTSGEEEIAVNAMQVAVRDSDAHWIQWLGSLSIHEAGFYDNNGFVPKTATLDRDGAAELLAEAFHRGVGCTGDYTAADHLGLADQPLEDVRAQFGIPPRRR